ncbi:hypothetical protein FN846DRAFT_358793 [Sphaerosporella brunnea]|uniref:DUF676 domain-containing protein n=1 Tax=Sphaerosporella brunnea TaxID=1250544 RepID=A0A5J5F651_9PEZI|nr:hypothetical protein FN846DRAFT_358793 [Sphaerosporella brunnea]
MDLIIQPSADSKRIPSGEQMMIPSGGQGKRKQRSCDDQSANEQRNPQVEQATLPTQDEGSLHVRNSASDHAVSSKVSKPKCIRILGIPKDWSETDLLDALETSEWSLKDTKHDISLYPACCGDNLTALLSLESHAGIFERLKPHDVTYVPVTAASGSETILTIDSRFYDLTPLNTPKGEIIADVVAVTGLVGHAFGSWRNRDTNKMWLKDFLPIDVQGFRIMTYGYNSNLIGNIVDDTVVDYRRQFIHTLCNARRGIEDRPIIFIGHGLGGILILQALLHCRNGRQYKQLFAATHAILFFGTPHQGMEVEELCAMVKDASPRATSKYEILRDLERSSNFLNTQREDITNLWDSTLMIDILSFYETKKTRTVRKSASGSWGRNGEHVEMVKKNSAQLFWPSEHRIPVPSDNIGMVKFGSRDDNTYQTVLTHMIRWKDSLIGRHGM